MLSVSVAWHLACKDWKLFLTDRHAVLLCFAVPIVLASLFGAVFYRSASDPMPRLSVCVVCEDHSEFSRAVVQSLKQHPQIEARETTRDNAFAHLRHRESGVVVILPSGFGSLGSAERPHVRVHCHPSRSYEGRWAEGLLTEAYFKQAAHQWAKPLLGSKVDDHVQRPFDVSHGPMPGAPSLAENSYAHSFCGMTLQYLLFWGMDCGLLFLRERRRGIWQRLCSSPVPLWVLLVGKVISISAIALLQIMLTFGFGYLVFGVRLSGSAIGFVGLALAAALLSATMGLLIASLGGTESRARSLSIVAILTLSFLGGLWLPSFLMPRWVQDLSVVLPTTWAVRGFSAMTWRGLGLSSAVPSIFVLLLFSLGFMMLALWRFHRSETRVLLKGER